MSGLETIALVTLCLSVGTLLYPVFRGLGRRLEGKAGQEAALPADSLKRLERMEHAIDAMAVEIERISEGQRFVTKVLAERERDPLRLAGDQR